MDNIAAYILDGLIAIALGLFTRYGVPYVKSLITVNNFAFVNSLVDKLVAAAEQKIQGSKLGAQRKAWVLARLGELDIVADNSVDALIDASVKAMNTAVDKAAAAVTEAVRAEVTN